MCIPAIDKDDGDVCVKFTPSQQYIAIASQDYHNNKGSTVDALCIL